MTKRQGQGPARILTDGADFSLQAWEQGKNSKPTMPWQRLSEPRRLQKCEDLLKRKTLIYNELSTIYSIGLQTVLPTGTEPPELLYDGSCDEELCGRE